MPDSVAITVLDPKMDIHIGELAYLHVNIQNIDTEIVTLKELQFRPDAGIQYVNPNVRAGGNNEQLGEVKNTYFGEVKDNIWNAPCTVYTTIDFGDENILEPGNQISRTISFRAGGILLKRIDAGKYNVVFTVRYEKGGKEYTRVETKEITIYYNFLYMIAGGILGGALGVIYRDWDTIFSWSGITSHLPNILFGILLGFMIIVILMRKSNVQSFISINDFWGALLAGFVAGVLGKDLISSYLTGIGPDTTNTTLNLTENATLATTAPTVNLTSVPTVNLTSVPAIS